MKCALIDLDETLFDHQYSSMQGLSALCELYPSLYVKTPEELEAYFWKELNENYHYVLAGEMTVEEARVKRIRSLFELCGVPAPEDDLKKLSERYKKAYNSTNKVVDGVMEMLKCLRKKGYCIVVLTNRFVKMQFQRIKVCGLEKAIDFLVTSEEVGVKKPEETIYREAMRRCGAEPGETVMIGDDWETDIIGAHRLGIRCFWLNRRKEPCPDGRMAIAIDHPTELLKLLNLVE